MRFVAFVALFFSTALAAIEPPRTLDDFADASRWKAASSDQVSATLRKTDGGLCLAYDFHGVSGYASMRRPLALDYPADYAFDVRVRGHAPENALQFKLTDAANENVWWVNRGAFSPPADWTLLRFKRREISFAWGPLADHALHHSEAMEFTVYADKGGSGEVCFADLVFRERPPPAVLPKPVATASSAQRAAPAANAIDGDATTFWQSARGGEQSLTLDLGLEREFGGLVLHWHGDAHASKYEVALSDDAKDWRIVRRVTVGNGGADPLYLPDTEARYLRVSMHGRDDPYALDEIEIKDLAFGASANAFFSALAKSAPRGWYPRGFYDEQTYWTIVGVDGGHETGLFSEDGALEVSRGGFSIAPIVVDASGKLSTWADAKITHSLADGYLPIPSTAWHANDFALTTTAFAAGKRGASTLIARYMLENTTDAPRQLTLALVVQPFQVNPAVQFLNTPGGVSPIHDLAVDGGVLSVNSKPRVFALARPDGAFGSVFDVGLAPERIGDESGMIGTTKQPMGETFAVHDDTGLASGALMYRIRLAPHASATYALTIPLEGDAAPPGDIDSALAETKAAWRTTLNRTSIRIANAQPLADTLRTALADILISRDGPALRPGTRSYARSWIRDGAMMSAALLRLGHDDAARDYLEWYAPYQFASGKVPCCVDARGSDPVPENDSHGELIYLAGEVGRYTNDRKLLETMWPHVDAAARYMDSLRASERGEGNPAFRGLMPASISHEGYSAKPMHSYWDDFWALTGYDDAVEIADALGKSDDAKRLARSRDTFHRDLYASIKRSVADHGIDYLPGCAELGDFDATSTTIALAPAGQQAALPQGLLHNTFERYWKQFEARAKGEVAWKDYTPYEWRSVATFVRLGWRDRAQAAIDFFMHDRRPAEWNQWAEVVGRDPRESRFVGDMPHGWVASDFIRSVLDVFAYERESDDSLVIAAGVPDAWLDGDGIAIEHLRTPFGGVSYTLARRDGRVRLEISGDDFRMPKGGIVFTPPGIAKDVHIRRLPAKVAL